MSAVGTVFPALSTLRGDGGVQSHRRGVKALQEAEERVLLQVVLGSVSTIPVDAPLVWVWRGEIRTFISGKVKGRQDLTALPEGAEDGAQAQLIHLRQTEAF